MNIFFFDSETNSIIEDLTTSTLDFHKWPKISQLTWIVEDENRNSIKNKNYCVDGQPIKNKYQESVKKKSEEMVLSYFMEDISSADLLVAHNFEYDFNIIDAACNRLGIENKMIDKKFYCTMKESIEFCNFQTEKGLKYPTLIQLFYKATEVPLIHQHEGLSDTIMLKISFWHLFYSGLVNLNLPLKDRNKNLVFYETIRDFIPFYFKFFLLRASKEYFRAIMIKEEIRFKDSTIKPLILKNYSEFDKNKISVIFKEFERKFKNYYKSNFFNEKAEILTVNLDFDNYSNYYALVIINQTKNIDNTHDKFVELELFLTDYFTKKGIDFKALSDQFAINSKKYSDFQALSIYQHQFFRMCLPNINLIDYKNIHDFLLLKKYTTMFYSVVVDIKKGIL
jgi:hypothetical protein